MSPTCDQQTQLSNLRLACTLCLTSTLPYPLNPTPSTPPPPPPLPPHPHPLYPLTPPTLSRLAPRWSLQVKFFWDPVAAARMLLVVQTDVTDKVLAGY